MLVNKEIVLIRHTTPDIANGICYGQTDLDVKQSYNTEVESIRPSLNGFNPDVVFSSPLQRCHKLANSLFGSAELHDEIMEMNFGIWELKRWDEIPQKSIEEWTKDFMHKAIPQGESFENMQKRVMDFYYNVVEPHSAKQVAIVTHSGCMRILLMHWLGIPADKIFNIQLNFGAVIRIKLDQNLQQVSFIK